MPVANVVPDLLVGAAYDLADRSSTVLAAKTTKVCVGGAFGYSALLPTAMLCAVGKPWHCVEDAFAVSAHSIRSMFVASAPGFSNGSAAFPVAHLCFAATVRGTPPFLNDSVIASFNRAPPTGTVLGAVPSLVDGDNGAQQSRTHTVRSVGHAPVVAPFEGFAAWDATSVPVSYTHLTLPTIYSV